MSGHLFDEGGAGETFGRVGTGNPEADLILGGGFPASSINLVMGQPGTGKTIFAEQLIFHNAGGGRPILYLTTLSEPLAKVVRYLQDFPFYDEARLGGDIVYDDLGAALAAEGIGALVPRVKEAIKTLSPAIIVIDSFKAVHDLEASAAERRRLVWELAGVLTAYDTTAFLLGEYEEHDIPRYPEFAVADGIVELSRRSLGTRDERFFRVFKLRGSRYLEGAHAFHITAGGLDVYPRLVSPRVPEGYAPVPERVATGVEGLDAMTGGGLWRGSATLLAGPSGAGKTTLALQFVLEGARRGEPGLYVSFQENPTQLARTVRGLGGGEAWGGPVELMYTSPVELRIDSILVEMFRRVRDRGVQRLVVDAVGDLAGAASDPQRLHDYLYALTQHLSVQGVTSVLTFETTAQHRTTAPGSLHEHVSSMADNLVVLEMGGEERTRRTVRVMKTRGSAHDPRVRELEIAAGGARIV